MKKVLLFLVSIIVSLSFFSQNACAEQIDEDLLSFKERLSLEIRMKECLMIAWKNYPDGSKEEAARFPVATVRVGISKYPYGKGRILKVVLDPSWYPTPNIVEYVNKKSIASGKKPQLKIGEAIPPGDPRNAMGTFKMYLSHDVPGKGQIYRIHGTTNPASIGKRSSSGCIRMKNSEGYPLAKEIKKRLEKKKEMIEVEIV